MVFPPILFELFLLGTSPLPEINVADRDAPQTEHIVDVSSLMNVHVLHSLDEDGAVSTGAPSDDGGEREEDDLEESKNGDDDGRFGRRGVTEEGVSGTAAGFKAAIASIS